MLNVMCSPKHLLSRSKLELWHLQERGKAAAIEGADRYLAALDGKYVQGYPDAGYNTSLRH